MTDEKKELPWNKIYRKDRGDWIDIFETKVDQNLQDTKDWVKGYFIPEPEARRLHALDERVKKFEEAAGILTKLEWSIVDFDDSAVDNEIKNGMKLLREAMGEG